MPRRRRKRFKNKATVTADSSFFRFPPYGHACAESQSVHDIYIIVYHIRVRGRNEGWQRKTPAHAFISASEHTLLQRAAAASAGSRQAGRKAFRRLKGIGAPPDSVSPHARKGAGLAQSAARAIYLNPFMIGFALPVTYRLFSLPVIFVCRPQRFWPQKKQSASSAFGHAVLMRKFFRVSSAFTRSDCTARLLPARSARAGSSPCRRLSAPLSP